MEANKAIEWNNLLDATEELSQSGGWELNVTTGELYWTRHMYTLLEIEEWFKPTLENVLEFYNEEGRMLIAYHIEQAIADKMKFSVDLSLITRKGNRKWVRASGAPVIHEGKVTLLRGAITDVTEEKESECRLLEANQLLQKDYDEMLRAVRVVAHDLRSPVNGMIGLASLLLYSHHLTKEDKEMVLLLRESGNTAIRLIGEILELNFEDHDLLLKTAPIELRAFISEQVKLLQVIATEKDQFIEFTSLITVPVVADINADQIARVINNIVGNAVKFSQPGKTITVALDVKDSVVDISITDRGIGISAVDQELIFTLFTPARRPGTAGEKSFGLGLFVSRKIIEGHHGRIWVESCVGKGTVFHIELPVHH